jgi:hypothetical protein
LDEAKQDIQNYLDRGQCYLPKPKAEADNIDRGLNNSGYPAQAEFNIYYSFCDRKKTKQATIENK